MNVSSGGTVLVDESAPSSYPFTFNLGSGSTVIVQAIPRFGYNFNGWSGSLNGSDNPTTLSIDCNRTITANFSIDWLLIGSASAALVLVVLLISILIIRRKTSRSASPLAQG